MIEFLTSYCDDHFERKYSCSLGGGGSSGGSTTTVQKADPWSGIQPQLTQAASDTENLYNQGLLQQKYFPGSTVAQFAPQQQQAIDLTTQRALDGSPVNAANQQQITDTLNGNYLDPTNNPGFQQALTDTQKAYSTGTAAQTDAAFNKSGAYGGSAYDETKQNQNKAYADSLNTLAGNMYQQGRTNQLQASALAPQAANSDYTDLGALANTGAQVQGQNQANITDQMNRFNFNQQQPSQNVANYVGLLNGAGGQYGSSTATSPYYQNNAANALGLGLGGISALSGINSLASSGGLFGSGGLLGGLFSGGAGASMMLA